MDETTSVVAHAEFPKHYGSDPVRFSGHPDALLERHLLFNDLIDPRFAGARQTFEAAARSVRDVLSQRWIADPATYDRENPKRIYYLSMEFLIGRSLANNVTNLMLDRSSNEPCAQRQPRLARAARAGTRCRPGQRRPRAAGRLLPRFDGDHAAAGDGLRPALRVRHVPAGDRERLAARTARQLAAPPGSVGGRRAPARPWRSSSAARSRCSGGKLRADRRPAIDADRHSLRPAGRRLRRQDHQHAAAVGSRGATTTSTSRNSAAAISSARWPARSRPSR